MASSLPREGGIGRPDSPGRLGEAIGASLADASVVRTA
jgi:hypothetical protein